MFSSKYLESDGAAAAAEEEKEEESALGAGEQPIIKSESRFMVVPMEIPEWMCNTICAGINLNEIMDGEGINEPPEVPVTNQTPQMNNPHMNTEEGMIINTHRKGYDTSIDSPTTSESDATVPNIRYNGTHECDGTVPDFNVCLESGGEISGWISERILNTSQMCNYDTGSCGTLYA